jgi:hypothetical protein
MQCNVSGNDPWVAKRLYPLYSLAVLYNNLLYLCMFNTKCLFYVRDTLRHFLIYMRFFSMYVDNFLIINIGMVGCVKPKNAIETHLMCNVMYPNIFKLIQIMANSLFWLQQPKNPSIKTYLRNYHLK